MIYTRETVIILALDSTSPGGSAALSLDDAHLEVRASDAGRSWSQRLPGELVQLLAAHGRRVADVDVFAVVTGPGSMTGLRVGIGTIQGFALATDRPVAAVPALDLLCEHVAPIAAASSPSAVAGAWLNAMRGEVFGQLCEPRSAHEDGHAWTRLDGPRVATPPELADRWRDLATGRPLVVAGDDALPQSAVLTERVGPHLTWHPLPMLAGLLVPVARRLAARGLLVPPHAVHPEYVRRPDAELARERRGR